jgi:RNA polymerase sigma factor (sigma-70 family)
VDERKSRIIELRYFGGLSIDEIAQALDLSTATVGREQRLAVAWLHREMQDPAT